MRDLEKKKNDLQTFSFALNFVLQTFFLSPISNQTLVKKKIIQKQVKKLNKNLQKKVKIKRKMSHFLASLFSQISLN